jgi:two-component system phosphate regulon response regulator PhoB
MRESVFRKEAFAMVCQPQPVGPKSEGDIRIDRETKRVRRGAREIRLSPTEFRLLEYFLERPGHALSRKQLRDGVWGQTSEISEGTVDVSVGRLRRALSRPHQYDPNITLRAFGYSLDWT